MSEFAKELGEVVPSNWCDSLLTGDSAALHGQPGTWSCPDIERLLNGIRDRIQNHAALAAMVSERDALRAELDDLLSGLREACDKVPQLPIETGTQESATDALMGFCYLLGAHESRYTARQAAGEVE